MPNLKNSHQRLQEWLDNPDWENPLFQAFAQTFERHLIENGVSATEANEHARSRISAICEVMAEEAASGTKQSTAQIDERQTAHRSVIRASEEYHQTLIEHGPTAASKVVQGKLPSEHRNRTKSKKLNP